MTNGRVSMDSKVLRRKLLTVPFGLDLDTVKAVKNAFGVSVNDVVMAMCAGTLRRWLIGHDALPAQPLVAMIPVSVRDPASQGALGNRVSAMLAPLPTNVTDGQGLNITLVGYLGQLHFGLVSSRELVPDIDKLAGYLPEELALLTEAAEKHAAGQTEP